VLSYTKKEYEPGEAESTAQKIRNALA
jgi:hypothetical protein